MSEFIEIWKEIRADNAAETGGNNFSTASGFIAVLDDLGLIAATGADAASFLHSQLTNDVEHLDTAGSRLAGYCSPKGRLLASMHLWKSGDAIMLQLARDIQAGVQKRLQMFVLRAKVALSEVTEHHVTFGLSGQAATEVLAKWFPTLPDAIYGKVESSSGVLIRVSDARGSPRYQWIAPPTVAAEAAPAAADILRPADSSAWRLTEIQAGIPRITLATQEKFVPQMINFEAIGGVNFKKGCYPGQEIVARSQYLGKLKRRMMPASVDHPQAQPGMEVFSEAEPGQPCGMLVNAEKNDGQGADCLVELKIAAMEAGTVHLGSIEGPPLRFQALPYPLPDAD